MVYRRDREKAPDGNSTSEISSDSTEEDLDNLIDDLLEKLAVCPSRPQRMTIKNRKERSKHERSDRSSAVDVAGTSKDDSRSFGFQRYQYSPEERGQGIVRGRGRQLRSHIPSTGVRPSQFPYPTYVPTENLHTQPLKRRWPRSLETSKKPCDQLSDCLDDVTEAGAGNNSEDEYYNITDTATQNTSKAEDNSLEQLLKEKKGLKVVRVHGDGACLFRSVSHQVYGDEEKHEIVRKQVVDYMYKNREHFSQYVTEDFDHYLHRKRQPTCYGNHLEIQAISELYNRPVEIYYNNVVPINVFHAEYSHDVPIRLRYCGRTHYNSIIDPCKPSFGHGLGMPNYQPGLPEKDLVKQAILESEASELEEAMLRDKLAESETKQLEDCIAEHVLRESLFEHVKAHLDSPTIDRQRSTPPPAASSPSASDPSTTTTTNSRAYQPSLSVAASGSLQQAACSSSALSKPSSSASAAAADPGLGDFAVLQHIPPSMLDMSEEDVLAMVLEQSRSDYVNSLRAAASKSPQSPFYREEREEEGDLSPGPVHDPQSQPTAQSYFRGQLDANEATSPGQQCEREEGGGC